MKILIVDDREENRTILRAKLSAEGFETAEAKNGSEALKKLHAERFDLIITDLMMAGMDGYQLTLAVKSDDGLKGIPIVIYTATFTDQKDEALALNLGASAFIIRPAGDAEFFATIRQVLDQAARGELPVRSATKEEIEYLRAYSERLIHKLEDKVQALEGAQRTLRELNATLEERVRDATAELRQTNQELEAFAYSVSHDLRSPLRSIQGFLSAISSNDPPLNEAERKEVLERSAKLALDAQQLIDDLLEYARLKAANLPLQPVSLARVVQFALDRLDQQEKAGARIEVEPLRSDVLGHEATLVQAVQNLLSNAVKFTKPGVPAHVTVAERELDGWVRLSIRDRGIGIAPEYRQRIFNVFERLHDSSSYAGTGIGLAIAQRAVQKMRGHLGLESRTGEGSTFWIELPRAH